jgi:hypothetical protein
VGNERSHLFRAFTPRPRIVDGNGRPHASLLFIDFPNALRKARSTASAIQGIPLRK